MDDHMISYDDISRLEALQNPMSSCILRLFLLVMNGVTLTRIEHRPFHMHFLSQEYHPGSSLTNPPHPTPWGLVRLWVAIVQSTSNDFGSMLSWVSRWTQGGKLWPTSHDGLAVTVICWGCSFRNVLSIFLRQLFEDMFFIRLEFGWWWGYFKVLEFYKQFLCENVWLAMPTIDLSSDHFSQISGPIGSMSKGSFFRQLQLGSCLWD